MALVLHFELGVFLMDWYIHSCCTWTLLAYGLLSFILFSLHLKWQLCQWKNTHMKGSGHSNPMGVIESFTVALAKENRFLSSRVLPVGGCCRNCTDLVHLSGILALASSCWFSSFQERASWSTPSLLTTLDLRAACTAVTRLWIVFLLPYMTCLGCSGKK